MNLKNTKKENNEIVWITLGIIAGLAIYRFFNKESKNENEDLKKEVEKAKIEANVLKKASFININNNTFLPNNSIQQTSIANSSSNQVSPKEKLSRWEKIRKASKLFYEVITGK